MQEPSREPLVLVVDDIRSARILAARVLVANGYEVIPAASAQAALHALAGTPGIDVVIADWKLESGDGLTLLKLVGGWYPQISRILWTVDGMGCTLAHELGIPCVEKRSHYRDLLETLRIVLGQPPAPGAA
jgi:DNA-binding NtrC family response regulator